ncbi:MAG: HAMP domain-containing sensor histidine kinase [Lachnospiraceae bacterium]|nr:HAMP domain-containing sensor histidine kinase [Lachnospiraceae bacterium]
MNSRKNIVMTSGTALAVSLLVAALTAVLVCVYDSRASFAVLDGICAEVLAKDEKAGEVLLQTLKEYTTQGGAKGQEALSRWGYQASDFWNPVYKTIFPGAAVVFLAGAFLFAGTFLYRNKKEAKRIRTLERYLEQVNTGKAGILTVSGEDEFSRLEDEIYKTVTFLYRTRDAAVQAKNEFAKNLSNIAHQIKTPITAMSLSLQMIKQENGGKALCQMQKQLGRLMRLEESLLLLSRLDAGTLHLKKERTDIFTLLVLAADNLQELLTAAGVTVDIPENGEMAVTADLDWTMEAVSNLMKNCMEHNKGGTIYCTYGQNPLYTEIAIWDEGEGFAKEDIPHLFERFYRGKNAGEGGIGIGLALAKEIIERQNGTIRAKNRPSGGACFEIRIYSH